MGNSTDPEEADVVCPISHECGLPPRRSIHLEGDVQATYKLLSHYQDSAYDMSRGSSKHNLQSPGQVNTPEADRAVNHTPQDASSATESLGASLGNIEEFPRAATTDSAAAAVSAAGGASGYTGAAAAQAAAAAAAGTQINEVAHTSPLKEQLATACQALDLKLIRSTLSQDPGLSRAPLNPAGDTPLHLVTRQLSQIPQPLNPALLAARRSHSSAAAAAAAVAAAIADADLPNFGNEPHHVLPLGMEPPTYQQQQQQQGEQQQQQRSYLVLEPQAPVRNAGTGFLGSIFGCFGAKPQSVGDSSSNNRTLARDGNVAGGVPVAASGVKERSCGVVGKAVHAGSVPSGTAAPGSKAGRHQQQQQQPLVLGGHGALVAAAVSLLLSSGADVNLRDCKGLTPLMLVAQEGFTTPEKGLAVLRVMKLMTKAPFVEVNARDPAGRSPLPLAVLCIPQEQCGEAVRKVQEAMLQLLLSCGADPNGVDKSGMTALMHAAAVGSKWVCQMLLQAGATARGVDNEGRSVLAHAMLQAHKEGQLALLGTAVDVHKRSGVVDGSVKGGGGRVLLLQEAVVESIRQQAIMAVAQMPRGPKAWLSRGTGSDHGSNYGDLHDASSSAGGAGTAAAGDHGHSGRVGNLHRSSISSLSSYSSISSKNKGVVRKVEGHLGVIRLLCSYGALDPHPSRVNTPFPGLEGRTQLHVCVRRGDVRGVQILLAAGAEPDVRDIYGNVPLMYWVLVPELEDAAAITEALLLAVSKGWGGRGGDMLSCGA